ncbi:hypothetical protein C8Q79DRAFT_499536 [Trametes meyenii]|nr:hypothetical protein C8Q79DRAFT_499536 [Trametes meyenii]
MPLTPPLEKPRHSLEVFDRLFERAFAPRQMTIASPTAGPAAELERPTTPEWPTAPERPETPLDMPDEELAEPSPAQQTSLETVWEEVLSSKSKELAGTPSKVKSLEGALLSPPASPPESPPRKRVARRRSR